MPSGEGLPWSVFAEHHMPAVDLDGRDHAVEVDGEACHTALADGGIELVVYLLEFFFQGRDIDVICLMLLENLQDLALYIRVGRAAQRDPHCIVPVFDRERGKVLEELRKFAVVVVADIEIGEDLHKAGADLAQTGLFAFGVIVLDHLDDRGLNGLGRSKKLLIAYRLRIEIVAACAVIDIGVCAAGVGRRTIGP